jgi:acyl carrier protein
MNGDHRSTVVAVLARRAGVNQEEITDSTRLREDLSLDGDDAIDAILDISRELNLDVSRFDATLYFNSEPSWATIFKSFSTDNSSPKRPLTVEHIVLDALRGRIE